VSPAFTHATSFWADHALIFLFVLFCVTFYLFFEFSTEDYAVVIIGGVFVFAGGWWIISAHKWFTGPFVTVESRSSSEGRSAEAVEDEKGR
jgi:hypothetical protein